MKNANPKFQDVWKSRLSSPVLQKVDLEKFFFDVERKFNREKRGSAIDVDIFANKASPDNEGELEHLEELGGVAIVPLYSWHHLHHHWALLSFYN